MELARTYRAGELIVVRTSSDLVARVRDVASSWAAFQLRVVKPCHYVLEFPA